LLPALLAGCTLQPIRPEKETEDLVITDDLDRSIAISGTPEKLISLAPSVTEILYSLDLGSRVVAVDNNSDYPAEADGLPKVSGYRWLDMEVILGLEPDLIFVAGINQDQIPRLEENDLVVVALVPYSIDGIMDNIRLVGEIMGIEKRANAYVDVLEERVEAVTSKTLAAGVSRPKVYHELDSWGGYWTYGPGTFGNELIAKAGGVNIAGNEPTQYPALTSEFVIASNPDIIIYEIGPWSTAVPEQIKVREGWDTISALKKDAIFGIDENLVSRPGPRVVDGLEEMAMIIHPELFD
jgi:iron complex transport system substrate-binding protein